MILQGLRFGVQILPKKVIGNAFKQKTLRWLWLNKVLKSLKTDSLPALYCSPQVLCSGSRSGRRFRHLLCSRGLFLMKVEQPLTWCRVADCWQQSHLFHYRGNELIACISRRRRGCLWSKLCISPTRTQSPARQDVSFFATLTHCTRPKITLALALCSFAR